MPYPSEHAFRIKNPDDFENNSFRRKNITDGIDIIIGKIRNGDGSMVAQAYRFKADKFTFSEAKKWMKDHDIKYISAEEATGEKSSSNFTKNNKILKNLSTPREWFNLSEDNKVPTMTIYDMIGSSMWDEGITPQAFINELNNLENKKYKEINIRINSPGGFVHDGLAIYNALIQSPLKKNIYIDGLAASAASFIAMAGDTISMPETAEMMIHEAWGFVMGTSEEMIHEAEHLASLTKIIANIYAKRTGLSEEEICKMMNHETWMNGKQAIEMGFADELLSCKAAACQFVLDSDILPNLPENFIKLQKAIKKRAEENALRDAGMSRKEAKGQLSQREAVNNSETLKIATQIFINQFKETIKNV